MKTRVSEVPVQSTTNAAAVSVRHSSRGSVYLALIVAVGAFFRFFRLSSKPLWQDEAWSWQFAQKSWPDLIEFLLRHEINMSPYHVLLKAWIACFGDSEAALRTLSVIPALLTIPVIYLIGKQLFRSQVGLVAALLFAVNAFHVRYSQETRGYTLAVLLVTIAVLLFVKAVERTSVKLWFGQGVLLAIASYIHMFAALVALALCVSLSIAPRGRLRISHIAAGAAVFGGGIVPLLWFAHLQGTARLGWIQPMNWRAVAVFLKLFCGNSGFPLAGVMVLCCASAGVYVVRTLRDGRRGEAWPYTVLLLWLVVPIIVTIVASFWTPVFVPRYVLICLPALALVVSAALCSWRSRHWAGVVLAALLIMSMRGIVGYYRKDFDVPRADWSAATRYIIEHGAPGDAIATRGSDSPIAYYERKLLTSHRWTIFAQEGESERPTAQAMDGYERVWCVVKNRDFGLDPFDQQQNRELLSDCGQGRRLVATQDVKGLQLLLFERNDVQ